MKKENLKNYAIALCEATENISPKEADKVIENFVKLLAKDNKLKKANKIIAEVENYFKEKQGIKIVEIISASKFSEGVLKEIKNIFVGELEIKETVDESLIGGLKIRIKDRILDASISKKISKMKETLKI